MHITIGYLAILLFSFWFIFYVFKRNKVKYESDLNINNFLIEKYKGKK
jgi:hypothetical protein